MRVTPSSESSDPHIYMHTLERDIEDKRFSSMKTRRWQSLNPDQQI